MLAESQVAEELSDSVKKANAFLDEAQPHLEKINDLVAKYGIKDIKNTFCFSVEDNRYRFFVAYDVLERDCR